jgi:hypothetical protein
LCFTVSVYFAGQKKEQEGIKKWLQIKTTTNKVRRRKNPAIRAAGSKPKAEARVRALLEAGGKADKNNAIYKLNNP